MLTAVNGNREAKINEDQKESYLKAGYDIIDENGNKTIAPSKQVSYSEYAAVKAENDKLKKELEKSKKAGA